MFQKKKKVPEQPEQFLFSKFEQKDMERVFTRLFSTDDGQKALAYLQHISFGRVLGPTTTDTHLRYSEGQRSMVAMILRMIDRGRKI